MTPDDILATYERQATAFDQTRNKSLFERLWLDRLLNHTPHPTGRPRVLDLGCGTGRPIAQYLSDRRCHVTGVDGAASMVALFRQHLPNAQVIQADMRGIALEQTFDAVLAWNSFFHLPRADQSAMFPVFARHMAPGATLMFTTGDGDGEAIGHVGEETVYHASLSPETYLELMTENGLEVIDHRLNDPACNDHTVWLARRLR